MKVRSLFAGIGGFDLGFHRAGFDVAATVTSATGISNASMVVRRLAEWLARRTMIALSGG